MAIHPTEDIFCQYHQDGLNQLVYRWVPADLTTPVAAYLKLCKRNPHGFLMESIEGGQVLGRYSFLGLNPDLIWHYKGGTMSLTDVSKGTTTNPDGAPLRVLRDLLKHSKIEPRAGDDVPPMAASGLFGYMGYDMIRLVEDIPDTNPDSLNIPDSIFMRPTVLVIFDNVKNMMCIVAPSYAVNDETGDKINAQKAYQEARDKIQATLDLLNNPIENDLVEAKTNLTAPLDVSSNTTREEYHDMVSRAVEYINAGDIFQVVPAQRFCVDFDLPSFELYRSLRRLNPSPFMFHFQFEDFSLVGASPEILVRVRDDIVTIRPIAGTRKRGLDAAEDQANAEDLLSDEKELAEHLMLLDLGRNDVGRVSEIGSVTVTEQFKVEYYSHVMHIVSNVEGRLRADLDILDALFSGFPAGTVSGAPKIRAMEIIDELEKNKRSYYGGCVGYLSGNGVMDTCIALRTGIVKDGKLYVQAGGGVVADSDPEFEYQETRNKARALIRAAEIAVQNAG